MGKYQLDDKGKAQVQRFHEKHSRGGNGKKERLVKLRQQFLEKKRNNRSQSGAQGGLTLFVSGGTMELRRPKLEDKEKILEMLADFEAAGSRQDGFFGGADFVYEDWLETIQLAEAGLGLPQGFVPYIQLISFAADGRAVGFLNLRLRLNDYLLQEGGHIGYSIRPSQRRKGLAKLQLELGIAEARKQGLERVLITCDEDNEASRRTILSAGGVYENTIDRSQRYWIDVD